MSIDVSHCVNVGDPDCNEFDLDRSHKLTIFGNKRGLKPKEKKKKVMLTFLGMQVLEPPSKKN